MRRASAGGPPTFPTLIAQTRLQAHYGDPAVTESISTIGALGNTATHVALLGRVLVGEVLVERGDLAEATRWMRVGFARLASMPDAGIFGLVWSGCGA